MVSRLVLAGLIGTLLTGCPGKNKIEVGRYGYCDNVEIIRYSRNDTPETQRLIGSHNDRVERHCSKAGPTK